MGDRQRRGSLAGDRLLMHARTLTEPRWTPLPHQVPPPGNWYGWLLLAGRGAGKTDACARYVHEHVMGPPCLPGSVPHWIGIIAPTLGDAATSCVTGPSGLLAHSPDAKMVTVAGGTVVRWPNGSEAKLFGANTEPDTERLRSGGNRSIAVGTPVLTERGPVPIEQVKAGDRVWTRLGLRPVLGSWDHGLRPIWTVRTQSGRELRLTPDHKVWTQRGWVRCDQLRVGDTLSSWNTEVTAGSVWARTGHGLSEPEIDTERSCCTDRSTKTTTAPSPRGIRSITRTTTRATTAQPTSLPSVRESTGTNTARSGELTGTLLAVERPNGTRSLIVLASSAGSSSTPGAGASSAPASAGEPTSFKQPPACSHALCAEAISQSEASPLLSLAPDAVETILPGSDEGQVWDLTVAGEHEFFAGGLLVSNCLAWLEEMAAWRYLDLAWAQMRFGLRTGPRPHWIASTTPKPRPLIKKLASGAFENVVLSRASMYDNPHLQQHVRQALLDEYEGTDLGRQELNAEILDEDSNALWTRESLGRSRLLLPDVPRLARVSIGVDPSGGAGEQGIVAVGKAMVPHERPDGRRADLAHGYVLGDRTCHLKPEGWGRRAVEAAVEFQADDICVEVNFGGDMAVSTIRAAADALGVNIPIKIVRATRGKVVRAQPVSALTEQGRWHMVGVHPELEDQYCTWYPELDWSPDRLDASVWPGWHNRIVKMTATVAQGGGGMSAMQQTIG